VNTFSKEAQKYKEESERKESGLGLKGKYWGEKKRKKGRKKTKKEN